MTDEKKAVHVREPARHIYVVLYALVAPTLKNWSRLSYNDDTAKQIQNILPVLKARIHSVHMHASM